MPLLVGSIAAAAHWPVLSAQALSFDDAQFLAENDLVKNPSWTSVCRFFDEVLEPSTVRGYYLPLAMTSLMLDYAAGGRPDDLTVFHRTSLALHALNCALLTVLLYALFRNALAAVVVAALFAVHPLTVEPIAWIGERKTLLATFFVLWSMVAYLRFARVGGWKWYVAGLATYILALLSKPTALPLPIILILLDVWPLARVNRKSLLEKIPFLVVALVAGVITFISHGRTANLVSLDAHSVPQGPMLVCHNLVFYVRKIIWPANLASVYPVPEPFALSNPEILLGVLGTGLLCLGVLIAWHWTRAPLVGWLIFAVGLSPTLGWVRYSWVATSDKYVYLPVVGLLILLAGAIARGLPRIRVRSLKTGILALAGLLLVMETLGTRAYLDRWENSEALFRHMVALEPKVPILRYELASALRLQSRMDEALEQYLKAIELYPAVTDARNNAGLILQLKGRPAKAIEQFTEALRADPRYPNARVNLASLLGELGQYAEAEAHIRRALEFAPNDAVVYNVLGTIVFSQGRIEEAIKACRQALACDPGYVPALKNLAPALAAAGEFAEAADVCRTAIELDPSDPHTHHNLAVALQRLDRLDEALAEYREALRLDPDYIEAHRSLGAALLSQGQPEKAAAQFRAALDLKPNDALTLNSLGDALFEMQDFADAARNYQLAVRYQPAYFEAHRNLGVAFACLGRHGDAIRSYQTALAMKPHDPTLHNNLGAALLSSGKFDRAIAAFREAVRIEPSYTAAKCNLGRAFAGKGDWTEAVAALRAALRSDPDSEEAKGLLAAALAKQAEQ